MRECSKSIPRRMSQPNFALRYFRGYGIDIGGKPDPLSLYAHLFPLVTAIRVWDIEDGDAQFMAGVPDASVDFVHSSHCLEHLHDPAEALRHWLRITRPGGYVIATVPDEDLYEQGQFPSTLNGDHKVSFTLWKPASWAPRSVNLLDLLRDLGPAARPEKIELLNATYQDTLPRYDQTRTPVGECAIEFVLRKAGPQEVDARAPVRTVTQPPPDLRRHYKQYIADGRTLKAANAVQPPFTDTDEL